MVDSSFAILFDDILRSVVCQIPFSSLNLLIGIEFNFHSYYFSSILFFSFSANPEMMDSLRYLTGLLIGSGVCFMIRCHETSKTSVGFGDVLFLKSTLCLLALHVW